jgi:hypothetical protein
MTVGESISFVRTMLDEPKYEYFGSSTDLNTIFIDALREASAVVARECWYRGDKEAIRPLFSEASGTLDGNQRFVMPLPFLFIDSVRTNFGLSGLQTGYWPHTYVDPSVFTRRRHRNPAEGNSGISFNSATKFVSRAEFTIIGGDIYATSNTTAPTSNKDVLVSYIAVPTVSTNTANQMPLAEYMHGVICDTAAGILYRKEHPGDDRPAVGGIVDVADAIYQLVRGAAK